MNEKSKRRPKDQSREQTVFQLNSRQSRNYLSARMVSLIRANNQNQDFSNQELIQIESLLRDEFQTNQWLLNICKSIDDESVFVTKEDIQMFEKCKTEGQDVFVTQSEVEELNEELEFLNERISVLRYVLKDMTEKLSKILTNNSNNILNPKKNNSTDVWLEMRTKLKEWLEVISNQLTSDITFEEPKDIVHQIITQLNDKIGKIDGIQNSDQWMSHMLDELVLTEDNNVLKVFDRHFCLKLEDIHKNLNNLFQECLRIKNYYEINVKEENKWRTDLMTLIDHLMSLSDNSKTVHLKQIKPETNQLFTKKSLIEEYSQFLERVQNQEFDEMQALIQKLNERIEILSDKK